MPVAGPGNDMEHLQERSLQLISRDDLVMAQLPKDKRSMPSALERCGHEGTKQLEVKSGTPLVVSLDAAATHALQLGLDLSLHSWVLHSS